MKRQLIRNRRYFNQIFLALHYCLFSVFDCQQQLNFVIKGLCIGCAKNSQMTLPRKKLIPVSEKHPNFQCYQRYGKNII
jgi:hypothetical protein